MGGTAVQKWSSENWGGWLLASLRPSPWPLLPAAIRTGKPSWYTSRSRPLLGTDGRQPGTAAVCRGRSGPHVFRADTSPRQSHVAAD